MSIAPDQVSTDFDKPQDNYGFITIAVDPIDPRVVILGTNYEGLWKSTDNGTSWAKINTGANGELLDHGRLWSLAIDPFNHNTIWTTAGYGAGGPLKSTDGGVSWTKLPAGLPTQYDDVYSINVDPYVPNHVITAWHGPWTGQGTNSGVSESTDGGAHWVNHIPPAGSNWGVGNTVWFLDNSRTWLLGSQTDGIWRTTDSGGTWTEVRQASITHGGINALSKIGGALFLAGGNNSGGYAPVSMSADDGVRWIDISAGLPFANYETVITDGTNLYTAPSFPVADYVNGPWYFRPIAGGTWRPYDSSVYTCYSHGGFTHCNGPQMGAYDPVNHVAYAVDWLGGVWRNSAG